MTFISRIKSVSKMTYLVSFVILLLIGVIIYQYKENQELRIAISSQQGDIDELNSKTDDQQGEINDLEREKKGRDE